MNFVLAPPRQPVADRGGGGGLQERQRLGRPVRHPGRRRGVIPRAGAGGASRDSGTACANGSPVHGAAGSVSLRQRLAAGADYRDYMQLAIPDEFHELVFVENARVFIESAETFTLLQLAARRRR